MNENRIGLTENNQYVAGEPQTGEFENLLHDSGFSHEEIESFTELPDVANNNLVKFRQDLETLLQKSAQLQYTNEGDDSKLDDINRQINHVSKKIAALETIISRA